LVFACFNVSVSGFEVLQTLLEGTAKGVFPKTLKYIVDGG